MELMLVFLGSLCVNIMLLILVFRLERLIEKLEDKILNHALVTNFNKSKKDDVN